MWNNLNIGGILNFDSGGIFKVFESSAVERENRLSWVVGARRTEPKLMPIAKVCVRH